MPQILYSHIYDDLSITLTQSNQVFLDAVNEREGEKRKAESL